MKKLVLKMCVLALMAAPGAAFAGAITLGTNDADIDSFANELSYAAPAVMTATDVVESQLGFGVSSGQNRYARFVLANATFAATPGGLVDLTTVGAGTTGFGANVGASDGVTIVSGGSVGSSCVVYQVTGLDTVGNSESDIVEWTYPNLYATTNQTITATYTLHETATSASCANIGTPADSASILATAVTGPIIKFAPSIVFSGVNNVTATADVTTLYKNEIDTTGVIDTTALQLGILSADIVDTNLETDGSAVDTLDLFSAASILVEGDFSAATTVTLSSTACDTPTVVSTATIAANNLSATFSGAAIQGLFVTPSPAIATDLNLCYNADGATPILAQDYTAKVSFTPVANVTLADLSEVPAGKIDRDGTVLKAPVMAALAGQANYIQLANMGTNAAPYTVRCFAPSGAVTVGTPGTVTAGNTVRLYQNALGCGAGANSVEFTLAVPSGNVIGSMVRQNTTTGDSSMDSLTGNN